MAVFLERLLQELSRLFVVLNHQQALRGIPGFLASTAIL
jgi:hypothetical protein